MTESNQPQGSGSILAFLRRISDRATRHDYDMGTYWNACEDAADEIETLERIIREGVPTQEAVRFRARAQAFSNLCDELVQFAECTCELGAPAGCTCGLKPILERYLAMHPSPFTGEVSSV